MSNSFNLPRNPADFRPPSPLTADGANPFSETDPRPETSDNPYGAPAAADGPVYKPSGFETTIPHRGGTVLFVGWLSVGLPLLGVVLLAILGVVEGLDSVIPASPLLIFNLAFSLPAWIMSWFDLKAIEAGAMHPQGRKKTRLGGWLGVAGTFVSLLLGLPAIVYAFYWLILELLSTS